MHLCACGRKTNLVESAPNKYSTFIYSIRTNKRKKIEFLLLARGKNFLYTVTVFRLNSPQYDSACVTDRKIYNDPAPAPPRWMKTKKSISTQSVKIQNKQKMPSVSSTFQFNFKILQTARNL